MISILNRLRHSLLSATGWAAILTSGLVNSAAGTDLGEALDHVKWRGIIGTWIDPDTKGEQVKIVYAWKFENKLIEVNSKMGDTQSISLMGFNPEKEEVYMMGGNNKGGGSLGKWSMDGEDAVLELNYVDEDGNTGSMKFKHHWVDKDTIEVSGTTGEDEQSFTITLVRSK